MNQQVFRFASLSMGLLVCTSAAVALDVAVKEVKDSRSTGQFFKNLEIEFTMKGGELVDAKGVRTSVQVAKDSTGKNLITDDSSSEGFSELSGFGDPSERSITVKLLNPMRRAEMLQELKGEIELYVPSRDPASTVTVAGIGQHLGKPITNAALKAAGVELTIHSEGSYAAVRKAEKEKQIADMKAQGADPQMIEMATSFMEAMGGGGSENSMILVINDPKKRLVGVEFQKAGGAELDSNGSMSSGGQKTLYFGEPVPDDANALIRLLTDKAVVKAPLQLANVQLP